MALNLRLAFSMFFGKIVQENMPAYLLTMQTGFPRRGPTTQLSRVCPALMALALGRGSKVSRRGSRAKLLCRKPIWKREERTRGGQVITSIYLANDTELGRLSGLLVS